MQTGSSDVTVNVIVRTEPPDVATLIASTSIDLVCEVDIDNSSGVDTFFFTWTGPNGTISDGIDYSITGQVDSSTLRIEELSIDRDNNAEYTCAVIAVVGNDTVQSSSSLILSVQGILLKICFKVFASLTMQHYGIKIIHKNLNCKFR